MHNALLEARLLPPGTDLKRTFAAAMLEWIDAGWQLGEFSSAGDHFFCTHGVDRFCTHGVDRRMIQITPTLPRPRRPPERDSREARRAPASSRCPRRLRRPP